MTQPFTAPPLRDAKKHAPRWRGSQIHQHEHRCTSGRGSARGPFFSPFSRLLPSSTRNACCFIIIRRVHRNKTNPSYNLLISQACLDYTLSLLTTMGGVNGEQLFVLCNTDLDRRVDRSSIRSRRQRIQTRNKNYYVRCISEMRGRVTAC